MPFCAGETSDVNIFYRTYGRGATKVLLIIGLAGTHDSWIPQIRGLTGTDTPNDLGSADAVGFDGIGIEACAFDNRGMGQTTVPLSKSQYTTTIMAKDAISLLDHLRWEKAHVFGHSMGAMIAIKLSAMAPNRILSLALLNVTGGGFECFPKIDMKTVSIAIRFLRAKTPEQRAAVDLDTHYTKEFLDECVGPYTRREILYHEYVRGISTTGMQSVNGLDGQLHACWTHKMTPLEIENIRSAGFLVSIIHGRYQATSSPPNKYIPSSYNLHLTSEVYLCVSLMSRYDVIAQINYARKIAEKLYPYARMVDLHGGHLVSHEKTEEVNHSLVELIKASEAGISPHEWTNILKSDGNAPVVIHMLRKLYMALLYILGLLVIAMKCALRAARRLKPSKIGAAPA
ncbi:hypothetical protein QQ045_009807 [Rhodiola kirilowii]